MPLHNRLLVLALTATQLLQFVLLPAWLLPQSAAWGALLVPLSVLSLTLWALIHECIHGSLGAPARSTARIGRMLAILFGAPWRVLRLGHLLHHQHNREPGEATEVYDDRAHPGRRGWLRAAPRYYAQILGGLYAAEVAAGWLAWLPARWIRRAAQARPSPGARLLQTLAAPHALREVRLDGAAVALLWAASALLYGRHAWMLAAALAARAVLISLHDNVYHYGTALASAGPPGSHTLSLPRPLSAALLHFNHHDTHHRHPRMGWRELPRAWAAQGGSCAAPWAVALLRQLRGPIAASTLPR